MPINKFTTLLDLARQAKILTGETATFDGKIQVGLPFSAYTTGVDTGSTVSLGVVSSETAVFSGNSGTTIFDVSNPSSPNYSPTYSGYTAFTWTNPLFSATTSGLTLPITILNTGTQVLGPYWTLTQTGMTGDYTIGLQYTGYSITYSFNNVADISTTATTLYSGFTSASQENFSAGTLDYKGPLDYISSKEDATVDGRLTTNKLTVTNGASSGTIGYVLTQTTSDGDAEWQVSSGGTFTGNTSASCITDLYITNLYGCSPITVHDSIQYSGSTASGIFSKSLGLNTTASGNLSFADGSGTIASGITSHSEGTNSIAGGTNSHAEGNNTWALGNAAHSEGSETISNGDSSHAEGRSTLASGDNSHAEGNGTSATTTNAHSEGLQTLASGLHSHAEGQGTIASNEDAHAEGYFTTASGIDSHAEGDRTTASGNASHSEGSQTNATNNYSHAEGTRTTASGQASHAEGSLTIASGNQSHAEGVQTSATTTGSHAEGLQTTTGGLYSHAEGQFTTASGNYSHAEGNGTTSSNVSAHAEGDTTTASGGASHSEGKLTIASGAQSHAEGDNTNAIGTSSHSQNSDTTASGSFSHSGGKNVIASGSTSFVHFSGFGGTYGAFSDSSAILGGANNYIDTSSNNSVILGGIDNRIISSIPNTIILGGNGITASTGDAVYVQDLYITNLTGTDPIATDGDGKIVAGTSDRRLKENIKPLLDTLNKVLSLSGVSYEYTKESNMGEGIRFGLIAQDVQKVIPEIVRLRYKDDDILSLTYTEFIPFLIESLKEFISKYEEEKNIIEEYTPTSTNDEYGKIGLMTRDDDYIYIKGNNGWGRTRLENF